MLQINSNFDSGNIEIIKATDPKNIELEIRRDTEANYFQWFHFQVCGVKNQECNFYISNAHESSYAEGWAGYSAVASYDREEWFRVPTHYDGKQLIINHTPQYDVIYYAFFAPYSLERVQDFICSTQFSELCQVSEIGRTSQQRPINLLTIGTPEKNKLKCWFIARQHCGETMASWFMEGLVPRLLDQDDPISRSLLEKAVFYIVPIVNLDGAHLGNLRANAVGTDLNRSWEKPSLEKSPEVFYIREKMYQTGVDFFMDVHGDESIPYVFLAGCEGNISFTDRLRELQDNFINNFKLISPDFQSEHGYKIDRFGEANPTLAGNHIGDKFDCLSFTLEMPFKDNDNLPDPTYGWSPARCIKLGYDVLNPLHMIINQLR